MFVYAFNRSERTVFKEDFQVPRYKQQQHMHETAVADLMFTIVQDHDLKEKNATCFSTSTCRFTFYVETCPFSGCTNKATTVAGLSVSAMHGDKAEVKLWFCYLSL